MTKDELIALRRERGKQELNIGDYVKIYDSKGNIMYDGKIFEIIGKGVPNSNILYKLDGFNYPFFAEDLELVKKPADEIKVGDRVEVIYQSGNRRGMVCEVKYDGAVDVDFGGGCIGHDILQGRIKKVEPTDKHNTITIPVKADFGEDVGFALLDRALELQKKYTELEGEIKRLYELVNDAMNGLHPIRLAFDNGFLSSIARMVCNDFRPLTEEEKAQFLIDIKNMADNLKKQK